MRQRYDADAASRDPELLAEVVAHTRKREVAVLDLGAGAGANMRFLAPRLEAVRQRWLLVDRDDELLARVESMAGVELATECTDFLADEELLAHDWDLITANAVFDLVSEPGLRDFMQRLEAAQFLGTVYFTINLDASLAFSPEHPADANVVAAFHAHMQREQPSGRSLGPDSAARVEASLSEHGWQVQSASSDWVIEASDTKFARANLAFIETSVPNAKDWVAMRHAQIEEGTFAMTVAHRDILATRRG